MTLILTPQNFLDLGTDRTSSLELATQPLQPSQPERERLRFILVGSPVAVTRTIQILDRLNFVEGYRWNPFVAAPEQLHLHPQPQEVLSLLTRELKQ